jgi:hypothetical protein
MWRREAPSTFCPSSPSNTQVMVNANICLFVAIFVTFFFLNQDLNYAKVARAIRTPFRNTEIMTARGFGKRNGEVGYVAESMLWVVSSELLLTFSLLTLEQQNNDDYRDEVLTNLIRQKPLLFPFNNNQFMRSPPSFKDGSIGQDNSIPVVKTHRLQIRDGTLKFRLNDGSLRTARGFGKRSGFSVDPVLEK